MDCLEFLFYSHSVVPGGFEDKSKTTRAMFGTSSWIKPTISCNACSLISLPGYAGTPVIKSFVKKVRMQTLR
jgi:hypothetical protein